MQYVHYTFILVKILNFFVKSFYSLFSYEKCPKFVWFILLLDSAFLTLIVNKNIQPKPLLDTSNSEKSEVIATFSSNKEKKTTHVQVESLDKNHRKNQSNGQRLHFFYLRENPMKRIAKINVNMQCHGKDELHIIQDWLTTNEFK